jgi:hypothetical protein
MVRLAVAPAAADMRIIHRNVPQVLLILMFNFSGRPRP